MDNNLLAWAMQAIVAAFCAVLWGQLQETRRKAEKVSDDLAAHKVSTQETFMPRTQLKDAFDAINKTLELSAQRMDQRLDRLEARLLESYLKRDD